MKRRTFIHALNLGIATATLHRGNGLGNPINLFSARSSLLKELEYHEIRDIKFSTVQLNYPRLVGKNARLDIHGTGPNVEICVIKTNQGASGWASLRGPRKEAESVAEELLGKKISDVFNVDQGVLANRYLPFDLALHDLAGVILEKPVYALLGHETPILTDYR